MGDCSMHRQLATARWVCSSTPSQSSQSTQGSTIGKIGNWAFAAAAPAVRNTLQEELWSSTSLQLFRSRLKSELFWSRFGPRHSTWLYLTVTWPCSCCDFVSRKLKFVYYYYYYYYYYCNELLTFQEITWIILLFAGGTSADTDDTAADGYTSADDHGTARYGAARHAVTNADASTSDPAQPAWYNARTRLCDRSRCQCRTPDTSKFHGCCPVTVGHICNTFVDWRAGSTARGSTAGSTTTAEDHLVWSVSEFL